MLNYYRAIIRLPRLFFSRVQRTKGTLEFLNPQIFLEDMINLSQPMHQHRSQRFPTAFFDDILNIMGGHGRALLSFLRFNLIQNTYYSVLSVCYVFVYNNCIQKRCRHEACFFRHNSYKDVHIQQARAGALHYSTNTCWIMPGTSGYSPTKTHNFQSKKLQGEHQ